VEIEGLEEIEMVADTVLEALIDGVGQLKSGVTGPVFVY